MPILRPRPVQCLLATGLFAALAACGGGGSSSDPIDPYMVTFDGACQPEASVTDGTTGAVLFGVRVQTPLSKTSPTQAMLQVTEYFYDASDCSGRPRAILSSSGPNTWLSIDGVEAIGSVSVNMVTLSEDNKLPGVSAGGSAAANTNVEFGGTFLGGSVTKDIYYLTGAYLYNGDFVQPLDANGYPTVLSNWPFEIAQ